MGKKEVHITDEVSLEEQLSKPTQETAAMFSRVPGDLIFLGVGGKIGPSLARMARRSCDMAGVRKRIYGVSLFESDEQRSRLEEYGIETIHGDLLDPAFLSGLPEAENVFFLAGMKFGSEENIALTWAVNSYLPALVAESYRQSRIVAFSTGCVYELVPVDSGGSLETDRPGPLGEYAQSCLGRERMFQYGSDRFQTRACLIRLNYSVELRYGVLVDIGLKVMNREPIDLSMGHFNVIWQGDMNSMVLRSLELCESPARILNITGPETLSVREVSEEFGTLFGVQPSFINKEAETALLNNPQQAMELFGPPSVPYLQVIQLTADWLKRGNRLLGKPTHYEVRDGKY
jgi:dTDP-4-dehydrorhamnose reductase